MTTIVMQLVEGMAVHYTQVPAHPGGRGGPRKHGSDTCHASKASDPGLRLPPALPGRGTSSAILHAQPLPHFPGACCHSLPSVWKL